MDPIDQNQSQNDYNGEYNTDNSGVYDLSMFENPDLSKFRPGPFLYSFDKMARVGKVFEFDPANIVFGPLERRGNNNSSIIRIQVKDPVTGYLDNLQLQTPPMSTIFGLSSMDREAMGLGTSMNRGGPAMKPTSNGVNGRGYKVDLSFRELLQLRYNRENPSTELQMLEQFFHSLYLLDQLTLKKAKESVQSWFAGSRQLERNPTLVDGLYKPLTATRFSKKKERYYAPALRVKAGRSHNNFNFKVFDNEGRPLMATDIVPDAMLTAVIEVTGIWFMDNNFGIGLRLLQTEVCKPEVIDTYCIAKVTPAMPNLPAVQIQQVQMQKRPREVENVEQNQNKRPRMDNTANAAGFISIPSCTNMDLPTSTGSGFKLSGMK